MTVYQLIKILQEINDLENEIYYYSNWDEVYDRVDSVENKDDIIILK